MGKSKLYAAYGSNMNLIGMSSRCPHSHIVARGYIEDFALEFRYYANIVDFPGQRVPVVIWSITPDDEVRLDHYEGVHSGVYRKKILTAGVEWVYEQDCSTGGARLAGEVDVMVYIMNTDVRPIQPPSLSYYNTIREGYEQNGMSKRPLAIAAIKVGAKLDECEFDEIIVEMENTKESRRKCH